MPNSLELFKKVIFKPHALPSGRSRKWKSLMKFADEAEVQVYRDEFTGLFEHDVI